jgi:hypothetical protein
MADSRSVVFVSPIPMVVGLKPLPVSLIVSVSACSSATAVTVTGTNATRADRDAYVSGTITAAELRDRVRRRYNIK